MRRGTEGWPALTLDFFQARVAATRDETQLLRSVELAVPPEVASGYRAPGQYLMVRDPATGTEGPYALASAPGEPLELLVKRSAGLADTLAALVPGDVIEVSYAKGPGFPLGDARGRDVLLFATGSGVAPIRAAWRTLLRDRDAYGGLHLFFGVRIEADLPYQDELTALEKRGVQVHRVFSRSNSGGYVQQRFRAQLPDVKGAVALLCGRPEMVEETTQVLIESGMPANRVHLNT